MRHFISMSNFCVSINAWLLKLKKNKQNQQHQNIIGPLLVHRLKGGTIESWKNFHSFHFLCPSVRISKIVFFGPFWNFFSEVFLTKLYLIMTRWWMSLIVYVLGAFCWNSALYWFLINNYFLSLCFCYI